MMRDKRVASAPISAATADNMNTGATASWMPCEIALDSIVASREYADFRVKPCALAPRRQKSAVTLARSAAAGVKLLDRRRVTVFDHQIVFVAEFLARLDVAGRVDIEAV